ncbi:MAG: VOC family protein [Actinomycetota bacterium]
MPRDASDETTTPHPSVSRVAHVALEVGDLATSVNFYSEVWGLTIVESGARHASLRSNGPEEHVLVLHAGTAQRLRNVRFEADADTDLDSIARSVIASGGEVLADGSERGIDSVAASLRFSDLDGHVVEVVPARGARLAAPTEGHGPLGVDHVVLEVQDLTRATYFYSEVLGFRLSDDIPGFMTFLRCSPNHHSLALRSGGTGIDHVAYTVSGWYDIAEGVYRLGDLGVERVWGPGRHGPGNNLFAYFKDPDGNVVEYTAEVAQVDEDSWEPRSWPQEQGNVWPTAEPR